MRPKRKITTQPEPQQQRSRLLSSSRNQTFLACAAYLIIAVMLTFPLLFRLNTSVYGPYDHASTDLFGTIYQYFWWIPAAVFTYHVSPMVNTMLAFPFGTDMSYVNFTGFAEMPFSALFGFLSLYNFNILFNLVTAALGMFLLVRYITGSAGAGFIAGIIFAFCPNMLVRSYTTFDSTQVQWIPFYTLYILKFIDSRTWKNAILAGVFLVCTILFSFPYYLVYLPVQTIVMLAVIAAWYIGKEKKGFGGFVRQVTTPDALRAWAKIAVMLAAAVLVFAVYYTAVVGGGARLAAGTQVTEQLTELSLVPTDYLVPHPRMVLLKDDVKTAYWDAFRPGKDPDSYTAYIGYIALLLAAAGMRRSRGYVKWIFLAGALVAFWSTLGPSLFGIPTPSGLIHFLYASFARRILIYKVFVQFGIAGLAGIGVAGILKMQKKSDATPHLLVLGTVALLAEYSLVPPALSVNLTEDPAIYQHTRNLPADSSIIEVPLLRSNGYTFQGYLYYQILHGKPLFNPHYGITRVPDSLKPFYEQMNVPIEACEYANLSTLKYLGITHLVYHWYIGTNTVIFRSLTAPALYNKKVSGLKIVYETTRDPQKVPYPGPYDYSFADLYEITAESSPIAITFDYPDPYAQFPGVLEQDFMIPVGDFFNLGWASALFDTTKTFYYPLPNGDLVDRLMRQEGIITLTNLSENPVDFNLSLSVSAGDSGRVLDASWNGHAIGRFTIGSVEQRVTLETMHLEGTGKGTVVLRTDRGPYGYHIGTTSLPANAVIRDVRARVVQ